MYLVLFKTKMTNIEKAQAHPFFVPSNDVELLILSF